MRGRTAGGRATGSCFSRIRLLTGRRRAQLVAGGAERGDRAADRVARQLEQLGLAFYELRDLRERRRRGAVGVGLRAHHDGRLLEHVEQGSRRRDQAADEVTFELELTLQDLLEQLRLA